MQWQIRIQLHKKSPAKILKWSYLKNSGGNGTTLQDAYISRADFNILLNKGLLGYELSNRSFQVQ